MGKVHEAVQAILQIPGVNEKLQDPKWTFEDLLLVPGVAEELEKRKTRKFSLEVPSQLILRRTNQKALPR